MCRRVTTDHEGRVLDLAEIGRIPLRVIPRAALEKVAVTPLHRQDVIVLGPIEGGRRNRLHQFRLIDRDDMGEPQAVAVLVAQHIAECPRVVRGVVVEVVIGVDDHFPDVGEEVVGQDIRVAVDRVATDSQVGPHIQHTRIRVVPGERHAIVIGFEDERDSRQFAPAIKDCREGRKPGSVGDVRTGGCFVVDRIQSIDQVTVGTRFAIDTAQSRNRGALGHDAPGQRGRITLLQPAAVGCGGAPPRSDPIPSGVLVENRIEYVPHVFVRGTGRKDRHGQARGLRVIVNDRRRSQSVGDPRPTGTREHQVERLVGFHLGVAQHRHADGPGHFTGREDQRSSRRLVVLGDGRCRAVLGRIGHRDGVFLRTRERDDKGGIGPVGQAVEHDIDIVNRPGFIITALVPISTGVPLDRHRSGRVRDRVEVRIDTEIPGRIVDVDRVIATERREQVVAVMFQLDAVLGSVGVTGQQVVVVVGQLLIESHAVDQFAVNRDIEHVGIVDRITLGVTGRSVTVPVLDDRQQEVDIQAGVVGQVGEHECDRLGSHAARFGCRPATGVLQERSREGVADVVAQPIVTLDIDQAGRGGVMNELQGHPVLEVRGEDAAAAVIIPLGIDRGVTESQRPLLITIDQVVATTTVHVVGVESTEEHIGTSLAAENVFPGIALQQIPTGPTEEAVIAITALERIRIVATVEPVVARLTQQQIVARPTVDRVVFGSTGKRVGSALAQQAVEAIATRHDVAASSTKKHVVTKVSVERVVAGTAVDRVVAIPTVNDVGVVIAVDTVVAESTGKRVLAIAARQRVISVVAADHVLAVVAVQLVVADATINQVVTVPTGQHVVTSRTGQRVGAVTTVDHVVEIRTGQDLVISLTGSNVNRRQGREHRRVDRTQVDQVVALTTDDLDAGQRRGGQRGRNARMNLAVNFQLHAAGVEGILTDHQILVRIGSHLQLPLQNDRRHRRQQCPIFQRFDRWPPRSGVPLAANGGATGQPGPQTL